MVRLYVKETHGETTGEHARITPSQDTEGAQAN